MTKSKLIDIEKTNITLENCPPKAKIKVYYEVIEEQGNPMSKTTKDKMTLTKLAKEMRDGFKQVNTRIDNLTDDVNSLKQDVKVINARLDGIDARLDYNGIKKVPTNNK